MSERFAAELDAVIAIIDRRERTARRYLAGMAVAVLAMPVVPLVIVALMHWAAR